VIFASGLKYAGVGTTALGWILCAVLLTAGGTWLALARPWQPSPAKAAANGHSTAGLAGVVPIEEKPPADDPAA